MTLPEQCLTLVVLGICLAVALSGQHGLIDRTQVTAAARAAAGAAAYAREVAIAEATPTAVRFDGRSARIVVHQGRDTLSRVMVGQAYGVMLSATRESLTYAPSGLGSGAANLTVRLTRGRARDSLTVSRLGRLRW